MFYKKSTKRQSENQLTRQKRGYARENFILSKYQKEGQLVCGFKDNENLKLLNKFKTFEKILKQLKKIPLNQMLKINFIEALRINNGHLEIIEIKSKNQKNKSDYQNRKFDAEWTQINKMISWEKLGLTTTWIFFFAKEKEIIEVPFKKLKIIGKKRPKVIIPKEYLPENK